MSKQGVNQFSSQEFEDSVNRLILNALKNPSINSSVPLHKHDGFDNLPIDQKYVKGQVMYPKQYAVNANYTSGSTFKVYPGFTPKFIQFNGWIYDNTTIHIISNGFAGVTSTLRGNTASLRWSGSTLSGYRGTDRFGGNSACYLYVSGWGKDYIEITTVIPADYTILSNILIFG